RRIRPGGVAVPLGRHRRPASRQPERLMALDSLPAFLEAIERSGELVRITRPVRTSLEIAEIAGRVMKSPGGGPALLFTQPVRDDGSVSSVPVAINLFGSRQRMSLALGVTRLDDIGDRIAEMLDLKMP